TEDPPLIDRPTDQRHGVVACFDIVPIDPMICTRRRFSRCIHGQPPVTQMVAAERVVEEHTCMLWLVIATGTSFVKEGPTGADQQSSSVLPATQKPRTSRTRPLLFP